MPPKASKRKAANGYTLPDPIPAGEVVTGITKKSWRIGKSIGLGGFGEIYQCSEDTSRPVGDDATLALKIEPHENGPLFVEMNFYIRAAQLDAVEEFKKRRGLGSLGMPVHRGSGSHMFKGTRYRFLVMDRLGKDLQKVFQTGKKLFPPRAAFNIALKVLDVLEYIHSKGYVHNDIKAQNLLLGHGRTSENDVYLVDFGLVSKYQRDGVHLEYKPDARKAHDGTIEYTSRDAHIGAHARRSDLEILGYNLVHWMSGVLPWMDNLTNVNYVHAQKNGFMNDIPAFLQRCFGDNDYPDVLEEFLSYVAVMEFDTPPDYDFCRDMFRKALKKCKCPLDGKLDFSTPKTTALKQKKKNRKRKISNSMECSADFEQWSAAAKCRKSARVVQKAANNGCQAPPATPQPASPLRQNSTEEGLASSASTSPSTEAASENPYAANTAALTRDLDAWSWERVLCSDPELLIRQASRQSAAADEEDEYSLAAQHRALDERKQEESLRNPTPAMLQILRRIEAREKERLQMTWQQQLQHLQNSASKSGGNRGGGGGSSWGDLTPNPLTPAMEEVIRMRSKRISVDIDVPITPDPSDSEVDDEDEEEEDDDDDGKADSDESSSDAGATSFMGRKDLGAAAARGRNRFRSKHMGVHHSPVLPPQTVVPTARFLRASHDDSSEDEDEEASLSEEDRRRIQQKRKIEMELQFEELLNSPSRTRPPASVQPLSSSAQLASHASASSASSTRSQPSSANMRHGGVQVSVQNLVPSPDKIRNKGSPVRSGASKSSPAAAAAAVKNSNAFISSSSSSSDEDEPDSGIPPRKGNKSRKPAPAPKRAATSEVSVPQGKPTKAAGVAERSILASLKSGGGSNAAKPRTKGRVRERFILAAEDPGGEDPDERGPSRKPARKGPEERHPSKGQAAAASSVRKSAASSAESSSASGKAEKRLLSNPTDEDNIFKKPKVPPEPRGRRLKTGGGLNGGAGLAGGRGAQLQKTALSTRRSGTSPNDWDWASVLLTNPEKILRAARKNGR